MKKINKILVGLFAFSMLFTLFSTNYVMATGESTVEISGDAVQTQIQANNQVTFTFRQRTQLRFNSTVDIDVNINCDALRIGVKTFEIEIECDQDMQMNMTCTEEQAELGLLKGNTYQIRNQNRYRYQEGFCLLIQCNYTNQFQAKLKIQATNENRLSSWAYYDETSEDWIAVPTTVEEGYLIAETDHFSYWTVLSLEPEDNFMIYIGLIGLIGIIAIISVVYLKKRK
ncbi:MAG: hypothetical protein ACW96X_13510 [Promethearchaeota archaeon]|jgi:hypothetical protein